MPVEAADLQVSERRHGFRLGAATAHRVADRIAPPTRGQCIDPCRIFEGPSLFGYESPVSASDRKEPPGASPETETPISSSGVVLRKPDQPEEPAVRNEPPRRRDSDPAYRLTPYRARFDVEMDDTAVSKVRDPSVSLILGPATPVRPREKASARRFEALASLLLGAALGVLLVVIVVLIARAF